MKVYTYGVIATFFDSQGRERTRALEFEAERKEEVAALLRKKYKLKHVEWNMLPDNPADKQMALF